MRERSDHYVDDWVTEDEALGHKLEKSVGIDDDKNGVRRSQLVVQQINKTHPSKVAKLVVSTTEDSDGANSEILGIHDERVAFLHEPMDEPCFECIPPGPHRLREGWRLRQELYGIRRTDHLWQEPLAETLHEANFHGAGTTPGLYHHMRRGDAWVIHGSDFLSYSEAAGHDFLDENIRVNFEIKCEVLAGLGRGSIYAVLKRRIISDEECFI